MKKTDKIKHATLVFPINKEGKILFGIKKRDPAKGLYSAYGGKIELGQTEVSNLKDELFIETGRGIVFSQNRLSKKAVIHFILESTKNKAKCFEMIVHIYFAENCSGIYSDTDEMTNHEWFSLESIPYGKMLPDHKHFLPRILNGQLLAGSIKTQDMKVIFADIYDISEQMLDNLSYEKLKNKP